MIATRLSSLALCAGLAGLALAQSPREPGPPQGKTQSFYSDRVDAATHEAMQGVWTLEQFEWDGERFGGRDLRGIALIDAGHLALEVHVRAYANDAEVLLFQSGIYRYQFNAAGEVELIALIGGDNVADLLELSAIPPGTTSRYRMRLAEDILILERPGTRLQLRRTIQPNPPFYLPPGKAEPGKKAPAGGGEGG